MANTLYWRDLGPVAARRDLRGAGASTVAGAVDLGRGLTSKVGVEGHRKKRSIPALLKTGILRFAQDGRNTQDRLELSF